MFLLAIGERKHSDNLENISINVDAIHDINVQRIIVNTIEKQADLLRERIQKTIISAPISGRVVSQDLENKIGVKVNEGETLMIISDCDRWVVSAMIKEKDISKLKIGNNAKIRINAFPPAEFKMFNGKIIMISNNPLVDWKNTKAHNNSEEGDAETFFRVLIKLDDNCVIKNRKKFNFQYGLKAQAEIIIDRKQVLSHLWEIVIGKLVF